jgi:sugar phosphate isomerase/epimerase
MVAVSTVVFDGLGLARGARILSDLHVTEVEVAYIEGYMAFDEDTFVARNGHAVAALFADHGVTMRAISAHTDLGRSDSVERLLRRLDFAAGAGVDTIVSNATTKSAHAEFMRTLEAALPRFADAGVVLAVENPGHGRDALVPDGRAGAAIVTAWGSPWLRLNYDIGNAYTYAQGRIDLTADFDAALPFVRRVHLKDVAETGTDWQFCHLGAGVVGYGNRLSLSRLNGMDVTVEHPIRLWRPGRADPVRRPATPAEEDVRKAISASLGALQNFVVAASGQERPGA